MGNAGPPVAGKKKAVSSAPRAAKDPGPAKRAPGRPSATKRSRDQRAHLLDAALACYVRRGVNATSLSDIAAQAEVTPALIHYYFGDAMQLRESVFEERVMPVFFGVSEPLAHIDPDDQEAFVAGFVNGLCRAVQAHPWLPALWVREVVSEAGALRAHLVNGALTPFAQMVGQRFARAQKEGRLNPDLNPRLMLVTLIGLTLFPAASAPIWRQLFQAHDLTIDDLRLHTLALLGGGLWMKP